MPVDEFTRQSGVIPCRTGPSGVEVLLITSRETGRSVIPKGNVNHGLGPREAAEREAYEEAGIKGIIFETPIGSYTYDKIVKGGVARPTAVEVYVMQVTKEARKWPEKDLRTASWMTPEEAAGSVHEPDLSVLLLKIRDIQVATK